MTKKRLRKLYNACRPALLISCRNDDIPDWMREMYDKEIKTVYYSFEKWYEAVRVNKSAEVLTYYSNEEIYYAWFYVWQPNRPEKNRSGFFKHLSRIYPD